MNKGDVYTCYTKEMWDDFTIGRDYVIHAHPWPFSVMVINDDGEEVEFSIPHFHDIFRPKKDSAWLKTWLTMRRWASRINKK
jgi:hypothetical protein